MDILEFKMRKRLLFLATTAFLMTACETSGVKDDYSVEKKTIPAVRVDLKKDVASGKICAWEAAHSENEKLLALMNCLRSLPINCGDVQGPATGLVWEPALVNAAQEHSNDMAENNYLSHKGSFKESDITAYNLGLQRGSTPKERAKNSNFDGERVSENITKTIAQNSDVSDDDIIAGVEQLLNTKEGCENIEDAYIDSIGIAKATREINGKTYIYWTQLFGAKKH